MRISSLFALTVASSFFALLLAASSAIAQDSGAAQDPAVLRIPGEPWQYHLGDDPTCLSGVDPACTWQARPFASLDPTQFFWLRYQMTIPEPMRKAPQLALLVQDQPAFYEIYANGHPIGGTADTPLLHAAADTRRLLTFPTSFAPDGRLTLVLHSIPHNTLVGMYGRPLPYVLAPADRSQTLMDVETLDYLRVNAVHYLCFVGIAGAAFIFLLLFSVNMKLREYLWLAASLGAVSILRVDEISHILDLGIPLWLSYAIYVLGNTLTPLFLIEFVFSFLQRPVPKIFRLVQILGLVELYPALGLPAFHFLLTATIYTTAAAVLLATMSQVLMLPTCFRSKLPEMRWIGASLLFITTENSARMMKNLNIPAIPQDFFWNGHDIDIRGIAYLLFAIVMLIAMTFRLRRIQDRNRAIEQEMAAARSVQQILIPDELPSVPGLSIQSAYLPAQEVGGGFFQVLPLTTSADPLHPSAFIVLGDVSGKGLKAAMTVSLIVGTLRTYAEFCSGPAELLAGLNRRLHGRGDGFVTCLALMIEPSGKITLANAAHPNPYLNGVEIQTGPNLPLGVTLDVAYAEISLQLDPNQTCTLVTDGVVEATSASSRELFGFDRTQAVSSQSAFAIAEAARSFGLGAPQADDITVLTIARTAIAEPALV